MDYDAYRRLIQTSYPDGTTIENTYDAEGNLLTETDRAGRITSYDYDALNRVIKTTYADNSVSQTSYDEAGRISTETDENGNVTQYEYDAADRIDVMLYYCAILYILANLFKMAVIDILIEGSPGYAYI